MKEKLKVYVEPKAGQLKRIIKDQKASEFVEELLIEFLNRLEPELRRNRISQFSFRTHDRGVTVMGPGIESFIYINISQKRISNMYKSADGSLPGKEKSKSSKMVSSKSFPVNSLSDIPEAIEYAIRSYRNIVK